jgi:hypothetical protein
VKVAARLVTFVPLATCTRTRDLITRVVDGDVVLVVDDVVVVVGVPEEGAIARTMRNVPPTNRTTMINTTASDGW